MNHNLLVGQSGGPTAVINGSLYGVVSMGGMDGVALEGLGTFKGGVQHQVGGGRGGV